MIGSLSQVQPTELKKTLRHIIGERNPFSSRHHLAEVGSFIEKTFRSLGLSVENDTFSYWGKSYRNIIGRTENRGNASLIILGAHYDSVQGTPGADDNASGVAVLLEAARILSKYKLRSQLLFCAFSLEEQNMVGSTHFAKRLKAAAAKVTGMISLEMVGFTEASPGSQKYPVGLRWFYPDRGDFIGVIGNWHSSQFLRRVSYLMRRVPELPVETLTVLGNGFLIPAARLSDHSPFWDLGYPAVMVTDTAFFRNPHYHRASDTLETLDLEFMAKVCQGIVAAVKGIANS